MTLTRANTEFLTIAKVAPLMAAAGMDSTTVDGTNVNLNGPIGKAVRLLGHTVTSAILVADADVAQVTDAETDEFLDTTELFTLEGILGNFSKTEIRVDSMTTKFQQLVEQVERKIKRLSAQLERDYGYGLPTLEAGYIQLDFAEHGT